MSLAQSILQQYQLPPIDRVEYLGGAGGFSGAQLWKVHCVGDGGQAFCLRRWPLQHPDRDRLEWINLVLVHVAANGCAEVAVPRESIQGQRYVPQNGYFWEVSPWMPGVADFVKDPSDVRLANVVDSLARFHLASAQVNLDFRQSPNARSRYDALMSASELIGRIGQVSPQSLMASEIPSISYLRDSITRLGTATAKQLATDLKPFVDEIFPVQPVIRDVWHDHILFTGDQVTGVVDFGAMQMDNIALDLARVLGSLVGDQAERWDFAFNAYGQTRSLQPREVEFALVMDRCASFLASLNWLNWILIEQRSFESPADVEKRISQLIGRLNG